MKIAFIATQSQSYWAGSEELWWKTARHALECGHRVAVVNFRWPEPHPKIRELRERGALHLQLARPEDWRRSAMSRWRHKLEFERFRVWGALASWGPDAVCMSHGGTYDAFYNGIFIKFVEDYGFPYIVISQWNCEDMPLGHEGLRRVADSFLAKAHAVAFVSERNLRVAERQIAGDLPNACVVRNPVNLASLNPVPYPESDVARMANVARLEVQTKGHDVLLQALGGEAWRGRRWVLRLYGSGPDRAYLERLAAYYGVADKVEFRGHVGDVRSIWADNQLLVMSSRSEGTPLALVEAMICGRAAVVTDVGGNLEWIDEPSTGFVAEAPSERSLDRALERAWEARGQWESMGRRAREVALSKSDPHPEESLLSLLQKAGAGASQDRIPEGAVAT